MNVLVSGVCGFAGGHLVHDLMESRQGIMIAGRDNQARPTAWRKQRFGPHKLIVYRSERPRGVPRLIPDFRKALMAAAGTPAIGRHRVREACAAGAASHSRCLARCGP